MYKNLYNKKEFLVKSFDGIEKPVKVGDTIGFKSDYEQYGEILRFEGDKIIIGNKDGFGGEYINGKKEHWEFPENCWLD